MKRILCVLITYRHPLPLHLLGWEWQETHCLGTADSRIEPAI